MELEPRKLYVGGLPPTAQQDELKDHFARYGEVLCVRVVRDHETGLGRGFAFVEFADDEGPRAALDEKEKASHVFGGKTVDVKRARVRPMRYQAEQHFYLQSPSQSPVHSHWYNQSCSNNSNVGNGYRGYDPNKIFLGGLRGHITKEDLQNYFEKFGTITDVVVIRDGLTQKSRGFGFITFSSEEARKKVLETAFHDLNGTKVETKIAIPRDRYYHQDGWQHSPMVWRGNSSPIGGFGVYPPHNMQYIVNNHYMIPLYPPHTIGDYGYIVHGGAYPNGYDSVGMNRFSDYSGDSKMSQGMPEQKQDIKEPLDSESNNIP